MPPEAHAALGASGAKRWLNCPPSAMLAAQFPDTESQYAAEGTLAHAIAELKARKLFTPISRRTYASQLKKLQEDECYNPEMDKHTDAYADYLREKAMRFSGKPFVALESRLDFSDTVPGGFGTGDCVMIGGDVVQIIDLKYGKSPNGRVGAECNPQMMLYALGAVQTYRIVYGDTLRTVRLAIFQPRLENGISEWETTVDDLHRWAEDYVMPRAALAAAGKGEFSAGDWCRFCPARAQCRAHAEHYLALGQQYKQALPPLLSDEELGRALQQAKGITDWIDALQNYALQACLDGKRIPGWKAVEGTSRRAWANTDEAIAALIHAGVDEALLYERVPVTAPKAEKLLGSARYKELAEPLVVKPRGKPALAEETDRRPAYNAAEIAFGGAAT